jgi:hypothetical protein
VLWYGVRHHELEHQHGSGSGEAVRAVDHPAERSATPSVTVRVWAPRTAPASSAATIRPAVPGFLGLIGAGLLGVGGVVEAVPGSRVVLTAAASAYMAYLAVGLWRDCV